MSGPARRVAVTGSSSGIGERVAMRLIAEGAEVIGLDIKPGSAPVAEYIRVDLRDPASIAEVTDRVGSIDALFNVAGVSGTVAPEVVVGINFVGTRLLTEALIPRMASGSAIALTASLSASRYLERRGFVAGLLATRSMEEADDWCRSHRDEVGTGYAISKDALIWYLLHRALELAPHGIRMNAIAPGVTETPILNDTRAVRGDDFLKAIPMPLGRMASADEQAAVLQFLGSPDAGYVTGQVVWVDGGVSAGLATGAISPSLTGAVGTAPAL